MLVIKVELWPFGFEDGKRELEQICIINDETGTNDIGNYEVVHSSDGSNIPRLVRVEDFDRKLGALELLRRGLEKLKETV